jgi:hypothetical protein
LEDRRISAKSIAEQLGISHEQVVSIIHEDLDTFVACFLPRRAKDLSAPGILLCYSEMAFFQTFISEEVCLQSNLHSPEKS